jgi:Tfp pilus assembly protein PilF
MNLYSVYLGALSCLLVMPSGVLPGQTGVAGSTHRDTAAMNGAQSDGVAEHERKAREYLQQRKPELARKEFAIVAEAEPGNLDAQANLGVLLYFGGQFGEAVPHLKAAVALAPQQAKLQALLGFSERRVGDVAAARSDLAAALPGLTEDKVRKQAGLELVEMDTAANDLPSAAATVAQLKATMPADAEVLYAAYRVYTDLAGEALLDLSLAGSDSAQMHQAIAHELVKARDNAAALKNLRAAVAADPHLPGAHFELAELLAESSAPAEKAEAPKEYELALKDNPRDDKPLTRLGDIAADKGDHVGAMKRYKEALALQPENAEAAIGLAHELVDTEQLDAALPLLEGVVKSDPTNMLAHYRLGALYRRLHRTEDAKREIADYQKLKDTREKLRGVYGSLRSSSPMGGDLKDSDLKSDEPKN